MNAIELLMWEHRRIEKGLDALEALGRRAGAGEAVDTVELGQLAGLLRALADERHHGKEEEILFETMVKHGFPREEGPVAVMLVEHDEGRAYVRHLVAASGRASWSAEDRAQTARTAQGFTVLLRQHIMKEDQILYPMAQTHLQAWAMDEIYERCRDFEAAWERTGRADWGDLERLVDRIVCRR